MKITINKILILFIFLSLTIPSYGQGYAKVKVIDNQGRTDEVIIGNGGVLGVEANLGEINLYGIPTDTLEIRTIQRQNMICFFDYPGNIDLKIDYRTVCATTPMNSNFIFEVSAQDYPVFVMLIEEEGLFCGGDGYFIKDPITCDNIEYGFRPDPGDTLFILDGIKPNRFTIYPEVIVSTETIKNNVDVVVFPNPTFGELIISKSKSSFKINKIIIYDSKGQTLNEIIANRENSWSHSFSNKGVYFISIETDYKIITKKILVH